jgi:hypothetical protein
MLFGESSKKHDFHANNIPVNKKPKVDLLSSQAKFVLMIYHALIWQEKLMGSLSILLSSMRRRSNVICGLSISCGKKKAKPLRHYYFAPTLTVGLWTSCAITRQDFRLSFRLSLCFTMPSNIPGYAIAKRLPKQRRGVAIFAKDFSGLPARKISKTNVNHFNAFGCPDSSSSPRFDPTRGRNIGSK